MGSASDPQSLARPPGLDYVLLGVLHIHWKKHEVTSFIEVTRRERVEMNLACACRESTGVL